MSQAASVPAPGQIARIRQRTYLVEQIVKPKRVTDSTLVRLSCVDDDNQGQPLEGLWEKELDPTILTGEAWETHKAEVMRRYKVDLRTKRTLGNCMRTHRPTAEITSRESAPEQSMPMNRALCIRAHVAGSN